jgi:hypothetical protein
MNNSQTLGWAVALTLGLGVAGILIAQQGVRSSEMAQFKGELPSYVALKPAAKPKEAGRLGIARPKMITVNPQGSGEVDWLYFDLPADMRAGKPENVETVALLDWGRAYVAPYEGGGSAYRHTCDVYVFDRDNQKLVAFQSFQGGEPPSTTTTPAGSDDYGPKPSKEIVEFLKAAAGR